jgi:hypothetical protein
MKLIGMDCATGDSKVGVALGEWDGSSLRVAAVKTCRSPPRVKSPAVNFALIPITPEPGILGPSKERGSVSISTRQALAKHLVKAPQQC